MNTRRILIVTQAVDSRDPVLGFFHRWIEEFAKNWSSVQVVCLRRGEMSLPGNVAVHSLGKEKGGNRLLYTVRFLKYIWTLRDSYDAVFVHMNPEYVVLGGPLWRILGKRVGLWYVHKSVTLYLRVAALFAYRIFSASKESIRIRSTKIQITGHGIDTDFFSPDAAVMRKEHLLSVGRLMRSKRHDLAIQEAGKEHRAIRIAGDGPLRAELEALAREHGVKAEFLGGISQVQLRDEYRRAARLIHRSETGSLDKVVLEAAACGCPVDTSDPSLTQLPLSPEFVQQSHSLPNLVRILLGTFK